MRAAVFALAMCLPLAADELPAFPGAEGFGATTAGGRGGRVLLVTSLDDSGPGSLRTAITTRGPRIIVFRMGGLITLRSPLQIREPYVMIAGQTAPGDGITIRGYPLVVSTNDVVIRFLRSRLGDVSGYEGDAFSIADGGRNVVVDHCSASWSIDESLSPSGDISGVTVQWCLIGESLWHSKHAKGAHGYGSLVRGAGGISLHHNLWAHHNGRNPRLGDNYGQGDPVIDVRNNVMYNYGSYCSGVVDGRIRVNYAGNYIKPGPNSSVRKNPISMGSDATEDTRFFLFGNYMEQREDLNLDNSKMFDKTVENGKKLVTVVAEPFDAPQVETHHPFEAFWRVVSEAGATRPVRDAVDTRIVHSVLEGIGRLIDSQEDVAGWPEHRSGPVPVDSDEDGMPDDWEKANGLDPNNPSDSMRIAESGYSNIEVCVNSLAVQGPKP